MFASPVPIQTMSGFDGATARSPMLVDGMSSKIGCHFSLSSLIQTPLVA
jgi:hypothetical protein